MPPDKNMCLEHSAVLARLREHENKIEDLNAAIMDIRDRLLNRPSWAVSLVITILVGICIGLSVDAIRGRQERADILKLLKPVATEQSKIGE